MRQQYAVTKASFLILFLISSLCIFSQNTPIKRIDFNGPSLMRKQELPLNLLLYKYRIMRFGQLAIWMVNLKFRE